MKIVLQEIAQDKIYLDSSNQVRITGEMPGIREEPELNLGDL